MVTQLTLDDYVSRVINSRAINTFDSRLVVAHGKLQHKIMQIPSGWTLMDALSYVFNGDPFAIADVLQSRLYELDYAKELMKGIEEGIKAKSICMTCIKKGVEVYERD